MFDCAEASACFSFMIGCFVVREDSSSRNSPMTGRNQKRIAIYPGSSGSDSLVGDKKEMQKRYQNLLCKLNKS